MLHEATKTAAKRPVAQPAASGIAPALAPTEAPLLERELGAAEGKKAWLKRVAAWAAVVLLVAGVVVWRVETRPPARAALTTSQAALDRIEKLRAENLASQADVDQARGQRDVAQADLAAARAQIIQTRAQLNYSTANMTYARIFAPIDGLVVSRNIDPGPTGAPSFPS